MAVLDRATEPGSQGEPLYMDVDMALANAGVPFEMHIFEQGDHGLALADQSTAHDVGQLNPDAAKWAGLCQAWLEKRFSLNLPQEAGW